MTSGKHRTHRTADKGTIEFARQLRKNRTDAEKILWEQLRRKALDGFRFRQQHPIGTYIADFFCDEAGLVIELDGGIHQTVKQQQRDRVRDAALYKHGLFVLRFDNNEIETNLEQVLLKIKQTLIVQVRKKKDGRLKSR